MFLITGGAGFIGSNIINYLVDKGEEWTFRWAEKPRDVSRPYIEIVEGALIRYARPRYNRSQYPYERSIHEGRYQEGI